MKTAAYFYFRYTFTGSLFRLVNQLRFVYNADKLFYACLQHYPYSIDKHGKTNRI